MPSSDDDVDMDKVENTMDSSDDSKLEAEEEDADNDRHSRMLQGVTGMPGEVFEGKKRKTAVLTEALPESECNINRAASSGSSHISIHDLLDPLHGKPGYSKLRKRMHQLERHSTTVTAPLPKADRERLERKAAYEQSKKDLTKWEPLVKRNREAPTIYFDEDMSAVAENSTVDAIVAAFKPRTEFEKKIASIVNHPKIAEAHNHDGAKLLELNKVCGSGAHLAFVEPRSVTYLFFLGCWSMLCVWISAYYNLFFFFFFGGSIFSYPKFVKYFLLKGRLPFTLVIGKRVLHI